MENEFVQREEEKAKGGGSFTVYGQLTGGYREGRDRFCQQCMMKGQDAMDTGWGKGNSA